jgi:hypothetical protein
LHNEEINGPFIEMQINLLNMQRSFDSNWISGAKIFTTVKTVEGTLFINPFPRWSVQGKGPGCRLISPVMGHLSSGGLSTYRQLWRIDG